MTANMQQGDLFANGRKLKRVDSFIYLGSVIGSTGADIQHTRNKALSVMPRLRHIWLSTINLQLKLRLYRAICLPVFLYGCETWVMHTKRQRSAVNTFHSKCLCWISGVRYTDRITNEALYFSMQERPLELLVQSRQLRWLGHRVCNPLPDIFIECLLLHRLVNGRRRRQQPKITYTRMICSALNWTVDEVLRAAHDREQWRAS